MPFRSFGRTLAAIIAVVTLCQTAARAVIVYSGPRNITIPNTSVGLFLNVVDGTSYTGPNFFPAVPGPGANWDINPFGTAAWGFFVPNNGGQAPPTPVPNSQKGYVSSSPTGQISNLSPGTPIGPSSTFNVQGPDADTIANGQPALIGFRFRNESVTPFTANYGWARVILSNGQPGTLVDWGYESTPDTAIAAGAVPEPSIVSYLAPCALLAGPLSRRRHRRNFSRVSGI